MNPETADCRAFGSAVPPEMVGELADVSHLLATPGRLRARLADDGYALLRGVLDEGEVMAAREAVFERLHEVGEIGAPARDGIATGASRRRALAGDLGRFWKSVVDLPALRQVTNGPRLGRVMEAVWGEPACGMDYLFLRAGAPGSATGLHYDFPFFTRTTPRMYTVWVPIGPVPVTEGSLVVVEGSRRFDDILGHLDGFDIELDDTRKAEVSHDPRRVCHGARRPPADHGLRGRRYPGLRHVHDARIARQPFAHRAGAALVRRALPAGGGAARSALLRPGSGRYLRRRLRRAQRRKAPRRALAPTLTEAA